MQNMPRCQISNQFKHFFFSSSASKTTICPRKKKLHFFQGADQLPAFSLGQELDIISVLRSEKERIFSITLSQQDSSHQSFFM